MNVKTKMAQSKEKKRKNVDTQVTWSVKQRIRERERQKFVKRKGKINNEKK